MFSFRLLSLQDVTIWTKLDNSWKTFGLKTSLVVWLHYNSNTLITLQNNLDFRSLRWLLLIFASCEWVKGIVLMLFLGMPMHEYNLVFSPDQVSLEWNYTHTSICNNLMYNNSSIFNIIKLFPCTVHIKVEDNNKKLPGTTLFAWFQEQ